MKKHLSKEISWQVLFLLGVIAIIFGRMIESADAMSAAVLGVLGVILFSLGVVNFLASVPSKKSARKHMSSRLHTNLSGEVLAWAGAVSILAGGSMVYVFDNVLGQTMVALGDFFFVFGAVVFLTTVPQEHRGEEDSGRMLFSLGVIGILGGGIVEHFLDPVIGQTVGWAGAALFALGIAHFILSKRKPVAVSGKKLSFF